MDEEEKSDLSPFLEDESDNDRVLDQAGESHVAATHPHPVAEAEQVLQQDRLLARLVMLVQLPIANVHLDRGRQIASVGFLKPVELAVDHLDAIGELFKDGSEDGLQFPFPDADLCGKRHTSFRQKLFQVLEIFFLPLGCSLVGEKPPYLVASVSFFHKRKGALLPTQGLQASSPEFYRESLRLCTGGVGYLLCDSVMIQHIYMIRLIAQIFQLSESH